MYRLNVEQRYIASKLGQYNVETDGIVSAR